MFIRGEGNHRFFMIKKRTIGLIKVGNISTDKAYIVMGNENILGSRNPVQDQIDRGSAFF